MLVPVKWLSQYVDISDIDIKVLEEKLIMSGSNTETVEKTLEKVKNIVVGKIISINSHPDADKLKVLEVDLGDEVVQIVTGATNVELNAYLPVCKVNSVLADGTKIKKGKLRGVESFGMLCSYQELGFENSVIPKAYVDGVWLLPKAYELGISIGQVEELKDYVIEFEITPNRADCLSILGMARETAATFDLKVKYPDVTIKKEDGNVSDFIKISIEDEDLCKRYAARVVKNIKIEPSPLWMQLRLIKAGMKPISNIVDVTNYVLLEYGQPVHAFDLETLSNSEIIVRRAKKDEKITTLDSVERKLTEEMLVIADKDKAIGIAGVMGGENTEVSDTTTTILIEVANFEKKNIRKTSKDLMLRSEASSRYEKGISIGNIIPALTRVCQLIEEIGAGDVVGGIVDIYPNPEEILKTTVRVSKVNDLLGLNLSVLEIKELLERLEIEVIIEDKNLLCIPPHYRLDLLKEIDYVEEVARLYGYDVIPSTLYRGNEWGALTNGQNIEKIAKEILVASGLNEINTYSFVSPKSLDLINLSETSIVRNAVKLLNPLGEEYSIMCTTLLPNLLDVLARNFKRNITDVAAFEIGKLFVPKQMPITELPIEKKSMVLGMYGENRDFYTLKGVVEELFKTLGITGYHYEAEKLHGTYHPGRCANIVFGDNHILGTIGEVHPNVLKNYDIEVPAMVAELDFNMIMQITRVDKKFVGVPKYPASTRDLAVLVKKDVTNKQILDIINKNGGKLLESVKVFDVYTGMQIKPGYKSMAYALVFRASDRTLVEEDVTRAMTKILKKLELELEAELR